jgi:uncharacterized membrane protein
LTDYIFLGLLILHVAAIVGWLGASIVFVSVLGPSLGGMSPEGRASFTLNVVPRYIRYVLITSILSLVFGVALYGYSERPGSAVSSSSSGLIWIQVGAVIGVVAFILALAVVLPASKKLVQLAKGTKSDSPPTEMLAAQKRIRIGAGIVTVLLAIVLILMIAGAVN